MSQRIYQFFQGRKGTALAVRVVPKELKNEIVEILDDGTLRIHLASPREADKTNLALKGFLADILGVSESKIEIVAGLNGDDKLVSILDLDAEKTQKIILENLRH